MILFWQSAFSSLALQFAVTADVPAHESCPTVLSQALQNDQNPRRTPVRRKAEADDVCIWIFQIFTEYEQEDGDSSKLKIDAWETAIRG